jgi:(p)ppGpp synthase/HD superfamily hydrolase
VNYLEPCYYSSRLLEKLKLLDNKNVLNFELINKSIYWARKYHGDQKRKSGEPYYSHPLEVAYMVSDYNLKTDVIAASILHDIIEDTEVTAGMILDNFSWRIAEMVDRLTRDRPDGSKLSVEEVLNSAYQLKDKEVLLIKLFDRFHNIQTIQFKSLKSQKNTALETWEMFLVLSASIDIDLEKELNSFIYRIISPPKGVNSVKEMYMLSELKEKSVLHPLNFENDEMKI